MSSQLALFDFAPVSTIEKWQVENFSADNFCEQSARLALEDRFIPITKVSDEFDRQSVSYQLSKKDCLHRWLKYKEGFSAELVNKLLDEFGINESNTVLDPFLGSGTTSLVCKMRGINSVGFDILPMTKLAVDVKSAAFFYDLNEISNVLNEIEKADMPNDYPKRFTYLPITEGAFPDYTSREISFFTEWNASSKFSDNIKKLVKLCVLNSLEMVSYTAKDGQYLRWDYRSKKMQEANAERMANGKRPIVVRLDKGDLPTLKETLITELKKVYNDIAYIQSNVNVMKNAEILFCEESAIFGLQKIKDNTIDAVITSPPYCNRYDYTRTYALELNYLGFNQKDITALRQSLLSCTVENKSKIDTLKNYYNSIGRTSDFQNILEIVNNNKSLKEINIALKLRNDNGDINNKGVLRMVQGYFTELAFIYAELFRVCKHGAKVAFVNDNVRYAGEVIPVDFISTQIAEEIGFQPIHIYTLKQQKGNSSQQMKKFGRVALRKSITVWEKH